MKILYIEDDRRLSMTLGSYFELIEEWEVLRAFGPSEALKVLAEHYDDIDVIVLDIMMPPDAAVADKKSDYGQDTGILLLDKLKSNGARLLPVVVLSARQDLDHLEDFAQVAGYLRKTLTPAAIAKGIREAVKAFNRFSEEK